jgi:hypothetical protein
VNDKNKLFLKTYFPDGKKSGSFVVCVCQFVFEHALHFLEAQIKAVFA